MIQLFVSFFESIAQVSRLIWLSFIRIPSIAKNPDITLKQMNIIGVGSLPLVLVTSIFVGAETIVQANLQFSGMVPMRYLGFVVSKGLITELGPVLTAFVVASRISTAIAAEIGSMKTTDQLDAMICLSIDSIRYVIMPKIVASIIMLPILVIFSEFIAFASSTAIAFLFIDVTMDTYLQGLRLFFHLPDMIIGITKTAFFGAIIAISGAHFGLQCLKGAEGIGQATTRAVMFSALLILVFDFLIAILVL
jgi:phospholipid/cholesterol/gamma-HCH transport system permease protein